MKYENLEIVGTSHIARQSLEEVEKAILEGKPDIVAVELDKKRLHALMSSEKPKIRFYDIRRIGVKGFIFSLIGAWAEKRMGEMVGVAPGSEMKKAITLARKNKIKLALIDQDIEVTLNRLSKGITWKEKGRFIADIVKAPFKKEKVIKFDLTKVPSKKIIRGLVSKLKERYPNVYRVLIDERNRYMAKNLRKLMAKEPDKKILAVLGAGHEEDIIEMLKRMEISYSVTVGK